MVSQYNPFKENRTEQMRELWKYYVPFPGLDSTGKPIVVQGGRGSGKTMFFQCNSWRQVLSQIRKNERVASDVLNEKGFIGIYYRVDTTFVSSMHSKEETHWDSIFETYLSVCILQDVLELLATLNEDMPLSEAALQAFVKKFSKRIYPNSTAETIQDFRGECDYYLDAIEDRINGMPPNQQGLRWVNAHRYINDLCRACSQIFEKELLFKIFIDEYETLQEYQQKIINTLIKHSTLPVIFNIGLRPKGMKTRETISETETIEAPHDYELLTLEFDSEAYPDIVRNICQKRIALGKEQNRIPADAPEDIEYYLGKYSMDYEIDRICQVPKKLPHIEKLRKIIEEEAEVENLTQDLRSEYIKELCDNAPIINSRLHYAILCKKTAYTPSLTELYEAYKSNNSRYTDWMHNRKYGAVFLLCKESKHEKMYYGFDVFLSLSSNIVRYFLELCEQTFRIAFLNGYAWDGPVSAEIQAEAARYVSEYKIVDIARYEPYGKQLRLFVQYLGQIFYKLHTAEDNTLGEPEPNHFNTKDLSLPDQTRELLASAVMCNVLQEGEPTKRKQSKLSPETVDYYLNKIYVPYFGISHRNQRKIQIEVSILNNLLSGDEGKVKAGFRDFFKLKPEQPVVNADPTHQISFFDRLQGGQA